MQVTLYILPEAAGVRNSQVLTDLIPSTFEDLRLNSPTKGYCRRTYMIYGRDYNTFRCDMAYMSHQLLWESSRRTRVTALTVSPIGDVLVSLGEQECCPSYRYYV